jgi:hypothetical protein
VLILSTLLLALLPAPLRPLLSLPCFLGAGDAGVTLGVRSAVSLRMFYQTSVQALMLLLHV